MKKYEGDFPQTITKCTEIKEKRKRKGKLLLFNIWKKKEERKENKRGDFTSIVTK